MYDNQGRKQFGDDLNDDESQPHRDGRERQGEVKNWIYCLSQNVFVEGKVSYLSGEHP